MINPFKRLKQLKDKVFWKPPKPLTNEEIPGLDAMLSRLGSPPSIGTNHRFLCPHQGCYADNQISYDEVSVPFFHHPHVLMSCRTCRRQMLLKVIWGRHTSDHSDVRVEAYTPPQIA